MKMKKFTLFKYLQTFGVDYKLKGFIISQIIFVIGVLPLIWWVISSLSVVFFEWIKSFF